MARRRRTFPPQDRGLWVLKEPLRLVMADLRAGAPVTTRDEVELESV
jgi:hypothetical protein